MKPVVIALAALFVLSACVAPRRARRCCPERPAVPKAESVTPSPTPAPEPRDTGWFRGDGRPMDADAVFAAAPNASVIAFGEFHSHPVGAAAELRMLKAVHAAHPRMALAMEFFERDTQADLDAYLAGELDEPAFVKRTRQSADYAKGHRALIEYCKKHGIPVIAANAPRPLVSGYRKFEGDYAAYRLTLSETELSYVADETSTPDDAYRTRFYDVMGPERAPTFFRSQSLWDDTMAESIARFRDLHPDHKVLFVVGAFHVRGGLGALTKYRQRRPNDTVSLIVMDVAGKPFEIDTSDTFVLRVTSATQ